MKLSNSTIDRPHRPVKVLQFGEGNFLRAFVDWMIDLANERGVADMSVAVVSPRFKDNDAIRTLQAQDGLYNVCLEGIDNGTLQRDTRLVKCVSQVLSPTVDIEPYNQCILSPELRFVVSNTTEAGIRYERDDIHAPIPATFAGKVTSMLYRRYRHFEGDNSRGLIFLPCELIEDNGTQLRQIVLRHAAEASLGDDFVRWVNEACIFCDTLVDRIVTGFPTADIDSVKERLGWDDNMVVCAELYHIWAIGGEGYERVQQELPLDTASLDVRFMPSIKAFRDKKVRILNGSHTGMVAISLLVGCETVLDAFNTPLVERFISNMVEREVLPVIDEDPEELQRFSAAILDRFRNPAVKHRLQSIALNSLSKWETRNLPTAVDYWAKHSALPDFEIFTFAALMALYLPVSSFEPDDNAAHLQLLNEAWEQGDVETAVKAIVASDIFQSDIEAVIPGFSHRTAMFLSSIVDGGMEKALQEFLEAHDIDQ